MKSEKIYIYKLTAPNGKPYVGQTTNLIRRLRKHINNSSFIGRALLKYEPKNFRIEILWVTTNRQTANCIEIAAIDFYNCIAPNGYNIAKGGNRPFSGFGKENPMYGKYHTKEWKKEKSKSLQGNQNAKGKHWSLSKVSKENHSKAQLGNQNAKGKHWVLPEKLKTKLRKPKSKEAIKNMRIAQNRIDVKIKKLQTRIKKLEKELEGGN